MSGRRGELDADVQAQVAVLVVMLRGEGMGWKELEEVFGRCRQQLWRHARAKMQQKRSPKPSRCNITTLALRQQRPRGLSRTPERAFPP